MANNIRAIVNKNDPIGNTINRNGVVYIAIKWYEDSIRLVNILDKKSPINIKNILYLILFLSDSIYKSSLILILLIISVVEIPSV